MTKKKNKIKRKVRLIPIVPNSTLWNKPLKYYKEYMSYVEDFNEALKKQGTLTKL